MDHRERLAELWPASKVSVRCGELELRWIDDDLLVDLAALAGRGIHADTSMPFNVPWTRGTRDEVARSVLGFQWNARALVHPLGTFTLELGVLVDGVPVGIQGASGNDWRVVKAVETGSWLGREFQGRGIGTRMRAAIIWAFFEGLGAEQMTSAAFADNPASSAVSHRLGYAANGMNTVVREGAAATQMRYLLTRQRWEQLKQQHLELLGAPIELGGFEALRSQLS